MEAKDRGVMHRGGFGIQAFLSFADFVADEVVGGVGGCVHGVGIRGFLVELGFAFPGRVFLGIHFSAGVLLIRRIFGAPDALTFRATILFCSGC